jgi:hypothetical protein
MYQGKFQILGRLHGSAPTTSLQRLKAANLSLEMRQKGF